MENKDFIISKFKEVKSLEYVPSNRANNTGIGKTFEDYIAALHALTLPYSLKAPHFPNMRMLI